jgi:hypothetical protein
MSNVEVMLYEDGMKVSLGCLMSNPYFIKYYIWQNKILFQTNPIHGKSVSERGSVQLKPSLYTYTDFREFLNILCIHAKYWITAILTSPPFLLLYM